MPPEITSPPATAEKPLNPFSNALAAALKEDAGTDPKPATTPPPDKAKAPAEDKKDPPAKAETVKTGPPKELFKKAPAKTGEKPAEKQEPDSAFDAIAEPTHKDDRGKAGWEALKTEGKTWERKALDLERQNAERKAAGKDTETLETRLAEREAKLKEYDEIVARARVEDHPDFRREFVEGRTKLVQRAQTIIEESGGDKEAIATALNLKGKARVDALREAAGDLDSFQAGRLGRVIDELTDLDTRGDAKRENAKQSYEQLQEQQRQKEADRNAQTSRERRTLFEDTARRLSGELEVLGKAEGHDDWNKRGDRIVSDARERCEQNPKLDPEAELLAGCAAAFRDDFLQADKTVETQAKEIVDLKAELKAIHSKSPSLAQRGGGDNGSSAANKGERRRPFTDGIAAAS